MGLRSSLIEAVVRSAVDGYPVTANDSTAASVPHTSRSSNKLCLTAANVGVVVSDRIRDDLWRVTDPRWYLLPCQSPGSADRSLSGDCLNSVRIYCNVLISSTINVFLRKMLR